MLSFFNNYHYFCQSKTDNLSDKINKQWKNKRKTTFK
jgi:hypothetical protein